MVFFKEAFENIVLNISLAKIGLKIHQRKTNLRKNLTTSLKIKKENLEIDNMEACIYLGGVRKGSKDKHFKKKNNSIEVLVHIQSIPRNFD